MADKTKAVALNRQCGYEYRKTIPFDLTRPVAGRQRSGNAIFSASVTAPTAQLNHNILISKQSSNLSLVSSKIVGCILSVGCTALQHTQYFPQWGECEPVAGTLILRTSFRVAKMQLGASPQLWGSQDYKYQSLSTFLVFLRSRRLISPFAAVTRNPAVLSPSSRSRSISSITSWGILTVVICDLAFFAPVAITETPCVRCISVYVKKIRRKVLRCISLWARFKKEGDIHLESAKPGSARNTHRASNQNSYVR